MAFDWSWFDRHSGAIQALSAVGGLVFTAVLVVVARQQQRLLREQDTRAKPRLALGVVNPPRWAGGGDEVAILFEAANTGGGETAPHQVVLAFTTPDGKRHEAPGRVHTRRSAGEGLTLRSGEHATFTSQIPLYGFKPTPEHSITLRVLPFGGPPSDPVSVPSVGSWT
ncbi:MAG: hypothetical protein LC623_00535 [Halobacteriales archaeon]|nr:hypothetical protein [Halobacteriales archaeon]